ncbi:MAG: arsenosugar biosynthesis radical SAM protein ArsS [Vicinamibacteria bacterium]|nr:arsenosugar biosynthesis radical SAM protein ArsS [Vicinamibacteria bacterium]
MTPTLPIAAPTKFPPIRRRATQTLQVNLGYRCNQACVHCHVNAGPSRTEMMDDETIRLIVPVLRSLGARTLDLTGGAPELHPRFRGLVSEAVAAGVQVVDRCNLTILTEPGFEDLAGFLARERVIVVASLPCYTAENVDRQRGKGVFGRSIEALHLLNSLGYGKEGTGLRLSLVFNPQGSSLPPDQRKLEAQYRHELAEHFDIVFTDLLTITNMPIQRFGDTLRREGRYEPYMDLLRAKFEPTNLESVMCRDLVSVDYRGLLYDCDFNQQLHLPVEPDDLDRPQPHLRDLLEGDVFGRAIRVDSHCFGCTAGQGSSCSGALGAA